MKIIFEETDPKSMVDQVKECMCSATESHNGKTYFSGFPVSSIEYPPAPAKFEPLGELSLEEPHPIMLNANGSNVIFHSGHTAVARSFQPLSDNDKCESDFLRLFHQASLCPEAVELLEKAKSLIYSEYVDGPTSVKIDKFLSCYHAGPEKGE